MTVELILTIAGTDTGPFNLYSDIDSFATAFEVGVSKAALLAGYSSSLVPDYTSTIRIMSVNSSCNNYIDITLSTTSTTTTALPTGDCITYVVEATSFFTVDVTYLDCYNEYQTMTLPAFGSAEICAIEGTVSAVGPSTITPGDLCTTTTTTTASPGYLSLRSATSDPVDACPLALTEVCYIQTASFGVIAAGDRVFTDVGMYYPFAGDGDFYRLTLQFDTETYSAKVDSNGYIYDPEVTICIE